MHNEKPSLQSTKESVNQVNKICELVDIDLTALYFTFGHEKGSRHRHLHFSWSTSTRLHLSLSMSTGCIFLPG